LRADLIRTSPQDEASCREVSRTMAQAPTRLCRTKAIVWVQDCRFLPLGAELRALGVAEPLGFFLHTPLPSRDRLMAIPHRRELVEAMLAHDLIGFQTINSQRDFEDYLWRERALPFTGATVASDVGGRFGEPGWTPIRDPDQDCSQTAPAGFYRTAGVVSVTPLGDGANPVAKAHVATRIPLDPGVPVLSCPAGAVARAQSPALTISSQARGERRQAMMKILRASSVQLWFADFVRTLDDSACMALPVVTEVPTVPVAASRGSDAPVAAPVVRLERH
jgi:trehalose-6-phosphate synthase